MAILRYGIGLAAVLALVTVALANRGFVTIKLLPDVLASLFGRNLTLDLPLFVIIALGICLGLVIGFIWEWLREMKLRINARKEHKENIRLQREIDQIQRANGGHDDDVLALLEQK